jgi:hypothetical protein
MSTASGSAMARAVLSNYRSTILQLHSIKDSSNGLDSVTNTVGLFLYAKLFQIHD